MHRAKLRDGGGTPHLAKASAQQASLNNKISQLYWNIIKHPKQFYCMVAGENQENSFDICKL